jgi:ribosome maturation protein Sdo1
MPTDADACRSEKDLDQVLQIANVFVNVSKGQLANKQQLVRFRSVLRDQIVSISVSRECALTWLRIVGESVWQYEARRYDS